MDSKTKLYFCWINSGNKNIFFIKNHVTSFILTILLIFLPWREGPTECSTAISKDVAITVWIIVFFTSFIWPRSFNLKRYEKDASRIIQYRKRLRQIKGYQSSNMLLLSEADQRKPTITLSKQLRALGCYERLDPKILQGRTCFTSIDLDNPKSQRINIVTVGISASKHNGLSLILQILQHVLQKRFNCDIPLKPAIEHFFSILLGKFSSCAIPHNIICPKVHKWL